MSKRYELAEMKRQTLALADDLPALLRQATDAAQWVWRLRPGIAHIAVVGSGDSVNAAMACVPVFTAGGVRCWTGSGTDHLHQPQQQAETSAVIGVSASGNNPSAVAALEASRARGCWTVAVTTTAGSPITTAADTTVLLELEHMNPSPGIRTYQASLTALLTLAGALGGGEPGILGTGAAHRLAAAVRAAVALAQQDAPVLANALASTPLIWVVSAGSGLGTARHIAAKVTETAAIAAAGVDIEDWWHIHRFAHDPTHPVLFLAAPGPQRADVLTVAERAAARRRVIVLAAQDDQEARSITPEVVSVPADVPRACRPLVDHVFAGPLAVQLAEKRGTIPFANP